MFKRNHHIKIATILQSLNADLLKSHKCLFGGGTAIVLLNNEFRESVDIDFLVSDLKGYQGLRELIKTQGLSAIVRDGMSLSSTGNVRADQYGIRTMLSFGETEIKFEIVFEARIELDSSDQQVCGVAALTAIDMAASKLLANSDRWADDSVFSRDVIDLAMLNILKPDLDLAFEKAEKAYGESIKRDLAKAIKNLGDRKGRLETCMQALKMESMPRALLWDKIRSLKPKT